MTYQVHGSTPGVHQHGNGLFLGAPPPPPPPPAPTGSVTISVQGQAVTLSGNCSNTTSAVATLPAATPANGAISQGPLFLTVAGNSFSGTFNAVPAGSYGAALVTLTGAGGSTPITGAPVEVLGIDGEAIAPGAQAPQITQQPFAQSVLSGALVTFNSAASGSPAPTPQWQRSNDGGQSWTGIAGASAASYAFTATAGDNGALFRCVWSNAAGTATSTAAALTVSAAPAAPTISTQPASQPAVAGQAVSIMVVASGAVPLAYQWRRNGVAIAGQTAATLTIVATLGDNGAVYSVVVSNVAGSVTSAGATLTVTAPAVAPTFATQPVSQIVGDGQPAQFVALAAGTAPIAYQWRRNGVDIAGATAAALNLLVSLADTGASFSVRATNAAGSTDSASATLTVLPATVPPPVITVELTLFETMAAQLALDLVDCPEFAIALELREAAIKFYGDTRAWRMQDVLVGTTVAGQALYAVAGLPAASALAGLPGLKLDGRPALEPMPGDAADIDECTDERQRVRVTVADDSAVRLSPTPVLPGQVLRGEIALKPARTAVGVPSSQYKEHRDALHALTLSRLMVQLGKPWTNPQLAAEHSRAYQRLALKYAGAAGLRSQQPRLRVRPNPI